MKTNNRNAKEDTGSWAEKWFFPAGRGGHYPEGHLARSKSFPGSSQQPVSTVMNWNNIYWNGMERPPFGWLQGDSEEYFMKFSQGLKFFLLSKIYAFLHTGHKKTKRGAWIIPAHCPWWFPHRPCGCFFKIFLMYSKRLKETWSISCEKWLSASCFAKVLTMGLLHYDG